MYFYILRLLWNLNVLYTSYVESLVLNMAVNLFSTTKILTVISSFLYKPQHTNSK
jgi:hypothetical protein